MCRAEFIRPPAVITNGDKEVTMSYDALRRGRHSLHHQVYCITTVTRGRHPLFTDINAARLLVRELRRMHEAGDVISLAWVVMPDHLHWLIQLTDRRVLSSVVKTVKARSALTINRHLGQQGSLWQRAYYDHAARKDMDVRQFARYIVANPLRAGLVRVIGDYSHWDCIWMTDRDKTPLVE
jgi:putative transposase